MNYNTAIAKLKSCAKPSPKNIAGMARFGINTKNALCISVPVLRKMAREIGKNQKLALELYNSGIHEAKILASMIGEPAKMTEKQTEKWVKGFDSWDVCDQVCSNLFDKTRFAWQKAASWSKRKEEFVKRAGFTMMAVLSVHDKKASDKDFIKLFSLIKKGSADKRNFVKKAVNWALRQIGKRNRKLNKEAMRTAREIAKINSKSAKWIAHDALRELENFNKF